MFFECTATIPYLPPSSPLRILQTCFSRSWGGLEIQALETSKQLVDRGHQVWLACCPGSRLHREATLARLWTVTHDVRGYFHPRIAWALGRFIAHHSVDLVHCQISKDISTLVPATRLSMAQVPVILSKRVGSYLSKRDPLHRLTYGGISRVLAISNIIHQTCSIQLPSPLSRSSHCMTPSTRKSSPSPGRAGEQCAGSFNSARN